MAKCNQCGVEYEARRSSSLYCGAKGRKLAFRAGGKVSVPEVSVPDQAGQPGAIPDSITDACGTVHKIDYEKRRKDHNLLDSWANGEGTPSQQRIGTLDRQDDVVKGYQHPKDGGLTDKGRRYLGLAEVAA